MDIKLAKIVKGQGICELITESLDEAHKWKEYVHILNNEIKKDFPHLLSDYQDIIFYLQHENYPKDLTKK